MRKGSKSEWRRAGTTHTDFVNTVTVALLYVPCKYAGAVRGSSVKRLERDVFITFSLGESNTLMTCLPLGNGQVSLWLWAPALLLPFKGIYWKRTGGTYL